MKPNESFLSFHSVSDGGTWRRHGCRLWGCLALCAVIMQAASGADFTVTSPGFFYSINGAQPNPTLTLVRGQTYTFAINTSSIHPFRINSPGASISNISSGTITYKVPTNAANYTYVCHVHPSITGTIVTVPPPVFDILSLNLGSDLVLRSTGASNWSVFPEFSTNLSRTNWSAITVQTNRFASGTNEIICGRPPGSNVFIRLKALRN